MKPKSVETKFELSSNERELVEELRRIGGGMSDPALCQFLRESIENAALLLNREGWGISIPDLIRNGAILFHTFRVDPNDLLLLGIRGAQAHETIGEKRKDDLPLSPLDAFKESREVLFDPRYLSWLEEQFRCAHSATESFSWEGSPLYPKEDVDDLYDPEKRESERAGVDRRGPRRNEAREFLEELGNTLRRAYRPGIEGKRGILANNVAREKQIFRMYKELRAAGETEAGASLKVANKFDLGTKRATFVVKRILERAKKHTRSPMVVRYNRNSNSSNRN